METALFTLTVRICMLKSAVMEALLYGCVTWAFGVEHSSVLHSAHRKLLLRIIGSHRRQRIGHGMSYAKALKKAQCESVETTIRKRRLLFAGGVRRAKPERLTRRVMFGTMAGGKNPGPARPEKTWARCLVDDIAVFRAKEGSTKNSPWSFEVNTVLWPTAAKQTGKWCRGIMKAADGFTARWHTAARWKIPGYGLQTRTPRRRARRRREESGTKSDAVLRVHTTRRLA